MIPGVRVVSWSLHAHPHKHHERSRKGTAKGGYSPTRQLSPFPMLPANGKDPGTPHETERTAHDGT